MSNNNLFFCLCPLSILTITERLLHMWTSHVTQFFEIFDSWENEFDEHNNSQPHYLKGYSQLRLLKLKKTATKQLLDFYKHILGAVSKDQIKRARKHPA